MGIDSTPFHLNDDFEESNNSRNLVELFGDPFSDVTSYLDGIQFNIDQRVVDELFWKISLMN